MESKLRSLIKAVSWRILGSLFTTFVIYLFTGKLKTAAAIGLIDTFAKVFIFYFHERLWLKINYGKLKVGEYQI